MMVQALRLSTCAGLEANKATLMSHLAFLGGAAPVGEWNNPLPIHVHIHDRCRDTLLQHVKALYDTALQHSPETFVDVIPILPSGSGSESGNLDYFTAAELTKERGFDPLYNQVALGGTFDRLHNGHKLMLTTALFYARSGLHVGITQEELLKKKAFGAFLEPYNARCEAVERFLRGIRSDISLTLVGIHDVSGGTDKKGELGALVVSPETASALESINLARASNGLAPMDPILIPYVGVNSENRISSTELRKLRSQRSADEKTNEA